MTEVSDTAISILCVDDERMILSSLRDQLRGAFPAASIETAESGEEGLEVFEELVADGVAVPVVISDQLMPGMRGEVFLEAIYTADPAVRTVLLTGQATADAVGEAVNRAQLYRYIGKPWTHDDLVQTVREAIRAWEQTRQLKRSEQELLEAHTASLRFVPREFLRLLAKERLVDVKRGDHVLRHMHILFADMRDYTSLIETMPPDAAFALLNRFIGAVEASVRSNDGFINSLEGDAILALFPGSADDAVQAGIDAHLAVRETLTRGPKSAPVSMGVAVHSGELILGTVGNDDRLKCDVVGDAVNVCARLERLTRSHAVDIIVSEATAKLLSRDYNLRRLGTIPIRGRTAELEAFALRLGNEAERD